MCVIKIRNKKVRAVNKLSWEYMNKENGQAYIYICQCVVFVLALRLAVWVMKEKKMS